MGRALTTLNFEEWLDFVFDHPAGGQAPEWYWSIEADRWAGPAGVTVNYFMRAFEGARHLSAAYTDEQLNQGLWYLASNACSEHMFALLDTAVPWAERKRCLRSMLALYRDLFAARCAPALGHLDEQPDRPLNRVCYMWWDILPFGPAPNEPAGRDFGQTCLDVMEAALKLDAEACQESALHGLGHWQAAYPQRVTSIIAAFLQRSPHLREPLKRYAESARSGCVL
jgi:hypothetical protein